MLNKGKCTSTRRKEENTIMTNFFNNLREKKALVTVMQKYVLNILKGHFSPKDE